jgi:hypothetical protein
MPGGGYTKIKTNLFYYSMSKKVLVIILFTATVFTAAAQSAARKPFNSDTEQ